MKNFFKTPSDFKIRNNLRKLYEKYHIFTLSGYFFLLSGFFYALYSYHLFNPSFFSEFDWDYYIKDTYNTFLFGGIGLIYVFFLYKVAVEVITIIFYPWIQRFERKDKMRR